MFEILEKARALRRVMSELVAQDAESARGVAEALSDLA